VDNATAAGATGVVIMNQGTEGQHERFSGRLNNGVAIPVVGVTYEMGRSLDVAARGGARIRLVVDAVRGKRPTHNVLAQAASESDGPAIVVGAHLDSVSEGPGINDNGSGSAAVLEAALQFAKKPAQTRGPVRFAFWGAEERGLVGSRHHVASLSEEQRRNVALYINYDMVASPNYGRFLRKAEAGGDTPAAVAQREFEAYFREHRLPLDVRTGGGRAGSDDASFFRQDVPTIAFYTGAGNTKGADQAKLFGGTANQPYDPCYHRACDTIENVNREALEQNTRALVRAMSAAALKLRSPSSQVAPEHSLSEQ
jgi:Zn-dependent M28 family amino/carboxypeptidase